MDHLKFTQEKLNLEEVTKLVTSPKCGAISTFIGITRDNFEGKEVIKLKYEAYEGMAIKVMGKICAEIRVKWASVQNIAIYHRLGTVPVEEASIIIAISSPHRIDAIHATEYCINNIKRNVPIWKKEVYNECPPAWKENVESCYPPKKNTFKLQIEQDVEMTNIPSHLIQIKASNDEIEQRINRFMEKKRAEIDVSNIRDFCRRDSNQINDNTCARIDSVLIKRKDSKGHLQVNKVYNNYSRDQSKQDYLMKYIPKDGVEERMCVLESQLCLDKPVSKDIYKRLRLLEDRILHLESLSPEYIQFWNKASLNQKSVKKKKIFTIDEIDCFITDLEKRKQKD